MSATPVTTTAIAPAAPPKTKGPVALPRFVRRVQAHRAMELLHARGKAAEPALVAFCWHTGGRISEVLAVGVSDIDVMDCRLHLEALKKGEHLPERAIPLPPAFVGELGRLIAGRALGGKDGKSQLFSWKGIQGYSIARAALEAAGVEPKGCHPRGLRHGFAVNLLMSDKAPLNAVQGPGPQLHLLDRHRRVALVPAGRVVTAREAVA